MNSKNNFSTLQKLDFHLPRVQTSDDQNRSSNKPVLDENEQSSPAFPLVQIAEKYRREYKALYVATHPNMGGRLPNKARPRTAPVSALPKNNKQESRARDELEIVEEANALKVEEKVIKNHDDNADQKIDQESVSSDKQGIK